jgi:hypothetical protein
MEERKLELTLPADLYHDLERIAEALGADSPTQVAIAGLLQWIEWRKAELDNRDPARKYFVNEALDELLASKK